ncbi:MAG: hypothetical protein KAH20_09485 [Methylococcales bacterium]|nr:hypothetical protein [Methylococcales bacterium]
MYAVIFRAEIIKIDSRYAEMASQMRSLAINQYGCTDFISVTEGTQEIAVSYWQDQEQIKQWKQDSKHLIARESGRTIWYKSYKVQVVEVLREYSENHLTK